eukprot:Nitzschia sp. Nitz4//scaffold20_size174350//7367//11400//NITZ4_002075-RA/size174350-processed-gene-0.295-mRNA-1//-1//CDS//3329541728//6501//frame0
MFTYFFSPLFGIFVSGVRSRLPQRLPPQWLAVDGQKEAKTRSEIRCQSCVVWKFLGNIVPNAAHLLFAFLPPLFETTTIVEMIRRTIQLSSFLLADLALLSSPLHHVHATTYRTRSTRNGPPSPQHVSEQGTPEGQATAVITGEDVAEIRISSDSGSKLHRNAVVESFFTNDAASVALKQEIHSQASGLGEFLSTTRRALHRHPELMFNEKETSGYIQAVLDDLDISYSTGWAVNKVPELIPGRGGYGIVADIGTGEEPCVLLRADMDALPIVEHTEGVDEFRSTNPGKMHACGHDGHTAMLLGAASILKSMEDSINGTVRLMFQPAEEGGAGAERMVDEGVLTREPPVQHAFGMHVWPTLPSGTIASRPGPIMAAAERFEILVAGVGGHAAMPHLTIDPIVTASSIVMNLQTIVSRTTSPLESGVVSVTTFQAGEAFNVIPASTLLRGTLRALSMETLLSLRERIDRIVTTTADAHGCNVTITYSPQYYPPTVNDPELFDSFSKEVGALVAPSNEVLEVDPSMGAEDFSFLAEAVPSTFFWLGQGSGDSPKTSYGLHHPHFALDEFGSIWRPVSSLPFSTRSVARRETSTASENVESVLRDRATTAVRSGKKQYEIDLTSASDGELRRNAVVESFFLDDSESLALKQEIRSHASNHTEFLVTTRRSLHKHPELLYNEKETSGYIQAVLDDLDISYSTGWGVNTVPERIPGRGGYGIVADIGTGEEPCVLIRADMDALPIFEETEGNDEFRSANPGKMHACGHDGHTAMLLGAASILKSMEDSINGTVRLMFQPAEEGGAGAKRMREEGVLTREPQVKHAFAVHLWPGLPSGSIGSRAGSIKAAAERFEIRVEGVGGHAAMPHLAIDPIVAAASIVMNLQTIVSRNTSPLESGVVSVTTFQAGEAFNVIPGSTLLRGTLRALSMDMLLSLKQRIETIVTSTADVHGCNVTITYSPQYYPPTVNDPELYESFSKYVGALVAPSGSLVEVGPTMGAEDFAFVAEAVPSTYFLLGQGSGTSPKTSFGLHHPRFAMDESVLPTGVELHVNLALRALKWLGEQNSGAIAEA